MRVERTAIVLALVLALAGLASSETLRVKIWRANLREGPGRNAPVLTMSTEERSWRSWGRSADGTW